MAAQMTLSSIPAAILEAVRAVIPASRGSVALHEPRFKGNELSYVKECIDTGWVSSAGAYVDRFEKMLTEFTGAKFAIATANGTAALHMCLLLVGVDRGDEVIIPTLTFIATANAVAYTGATPHFVDCDVQTLGIDPHKLEAHLREVAEVRDAVCVNRTTGAIIRALMPMHTFGHPVNLESIGEICERWHIILVEDAAESLGSYYQGRHTGTFGRVSGLSFNGNKVVTTGGGGAVLTNDPVLARRAKHLTTTARVPHKWSFLHDEIGYNYRLPNLNAALGCAQLEQLPGFLQHKRALAQQYIEAFRTVEGASIVVEPAGCHSNYWLNTVLLHDRNLAIRDTVLEVLNGAGLMSRPAWTLMHRLPMFERCPSADLSCAQALEDRIINVPSSPFLAE